MIIFLKSNQMYLVVFLSFSFFLSQSHFFLSITFLFHNLLFNYVLLSQKKLHSPIILFFASSSSIVVCFFFLIGQKQ